MSSRATACLRGMLTTDARQTRDNNIRQIAPIRQLHFLSSSLSKSTYILLRRCFADERKQPLQPCLHHSVGLAAEAPRAVDRLLHLAPEVAAQHEVAHLLAPGGVGHVEEVRLTPRIPDQKGCRKDCKPA